MITMAQTMPADPSPDGSGDGSGGAPKLSAEQAKKLKGTPFMLEHRVEAGRVLDTWMADNVLYVRVGIYNTEAGRRAKVLMAESMEKITPAKTDE